MLAWIKSLYADPKTHYRNIVFTFCIAIIFLSTVMWFFALTN